MASEQKTNTHSSLLQKGEIVKIYGTHTYNTLISMEIPPAIVRWGTRFWDTRTIEDVWNQRLRPKIYGLKKTHLAHLLGLSREWFYTLLERGVLPEPGILQTERGPMKAYSLDQAWDFYQNLSLYTDDWRNRKKLKLTTKEEMIAYFEEQKMEKRRKRKPRRKKKDILASPSLRRS